VPAAAPQSSQTLFRSGQWCKVRIMDRRTFVKAMVNFSAITAITGVAGRNVYGAQATRQSPSPLKQLGAHCGLRIGSAISKDQLHQFPGFASFFTSNFNLLTPNSEMKWSALHPAPDRYDFAAADAIVSFAQTNGIAIHGHNLCWNTGNPAWLANTLTSGNAKTILQDHIKTVMTRYKGKMDSWDVVNEPIGTWFNRPDGLYGGPWVDALGPKYLDIAFFAAAEADPNPLRILNVHNVEHGDPDSAKARQATVNLATRLVKGHVPIQAVGIESHLDAWRPIDTAALTEFVKALRDLGLQVLVTEFDVNDSKISGSIAARDQAVASYYHSYVSAFYAAAGTPNRLILWSPTDRENWMNYVQNVPRWRRDDGDRTHRPGILDDNMNPKPSFFALASAIQSIRGS
jgi:endo-1,4-beta-xylanase